MHFKEKMSEANLLIGCHAGVLESPGQCALKGGRGGRLPQVQRSGVALHGCAWPLRAPDLGFVCVSEVVGYR